MNLLPFFVMDPLQAARFREATLGQENRLEPRLVEAGPHKGKYVLPERVRDNDAFADQRDAFAVMDVVAIDAEVAFPAPPEE